MANNEKKLGVTKKELDSSVLTKVAEISTHLPVEPGKDQKFIELDQRVVTGFMQSEQAIQEVLLVQRDVFVRKIQIKRQIDMVNQQLEELKKREEQVEQEYLKLTDKRNQQVDTILAQNGYALGTICRLDPNSRKLVIETEV